MNKEEKIYIVVTSFLKNPNLTIAQLAELPELQGIPKSSISRYLNDPLIIKLFNEKVFNNIKDTLKLKGIEARRKGGLKSFQNNQALKDENGRFIGSEANKDEERIKRKIKHILIFAQLLLTNPNNSLEDIANMYNESNPENETVTRDYVYDCLSEHQKYNVFSEEISNTLAVLLEQRRILGNKNGANITNENRKR